MADTCVCGGNATGPNGPLMKEVADPFKDKDGNYTCGYVPRPGNINAWDLPEFVAAVKQTGKKQLIIAGIVTEVCVAFPTLAALAEGFEVFVVADASGTFSEAVRQASHQRMVAAGAVMTSCFAVACELFRDWRNALPGSEPGKDLAELCNAYLANYAAVTQSYNAAVASVQK